MKRVFLYLCCICGVVSLFAQEQRETKRDIFQDMPFVKVEQDSSIYFLLQSKIGNVEGEEIEMDGYRVQVYSSNRQQTAKSEAMQLEQTLADHIDRKVYVVYNSPFWKVRIGDFRTVEDAAAYKDEIVRQFPNLQASTYIVPDKIIVRTNQ